MNKERIIQISELATYTTSIAQITCEKCKKMDECSLEIDVFDALDYFYDEGWRIENDKCFCYKCLENKEK